VRFHRVPQGETGVYLVMVASPLLDLCNRPCLFQIGEDPLHGTLRNPDGGGKVSDPLLGVVRKANQDVAMVGEKCPGSG